MKSDILDDHIGIFHDSLRKHGKKVTFYYYATKKGQLHTKTMNKWYDNVSEATEPLNKVITRSTTRGETIS